MTRSAVSLLCLTMVLSGAAGARAAEAPIAPEARKFFQAGVTFLDDPEGARYEEAYNAFKAAYAISPSPNMLGNIGLCAMKLERDSEAIEAYTRYLRTATDIPEGERMQIERDLNALRTNVATVALWVTPARFTVVDRRLRNAGAAVVNSYEGKGGGVTLGLRPGAHELHIRAEGHQEMMLVTNVLGGAQESRTVTLIPVGGAPPAPVRPRQERPSLVAPVVLTSVGGALLATGAVTGLIALNKTRQLDKDCPSNQCPVGYNLSEQRNDARVLVRVTDGLLLGGGLVAAAGVTWLTLLLTHDSSPAQSASRRIDGGAACTGSGCAGALRVTFLDD